MKLRSSIQKAARAGDLIEIDFEDDLNALILMIRGSLDIDPIAREVSEDDVKALLNKLTALSDMPSHSTFLTKRELLDLDMICLVMSTMTVEEGFPLSGEKRTQISEAIEAITDSLYPVPRG